MWAFVKSVLLGTAAAAAIPLVLTAILAMSSIPDNIGGDGHVFDAIVFAVLFSFYPIYITLPIVLTASLIFGLPIATLLKRTGRESFNTYVLCGLVLGALIPVVFLASVQAGDEYYYWLPLLGAVSGTVTAHTWWSETCDQEVG